MLHLPLFSHCVHRGHDLIAGAGLSYEEAAEVADCKLGTVKSRINRARNKLQEILGVSGEGDYGPDANSSAVIKKAFAV